MQTAPKKERLMGKIMGDEDVQKLIEQCLAAYKEYQVQQDAYNYAVACLWFQQNKPPFMNVKILQNQRFDHECTGLLNIKGMARSTILTLLSQISIADSNFNSEKESGLYQERKNLGLAENELNSLRKQIKTKLNADVCDKRYGISAGFIIKDDGDDAVYIKNDFHSQQEDQLTFPFVSILLHKMGIGPLCDFTYNKKTKELTTFSAQLGGSKCKKFLKQDQLSTKQKTQCVNASLVPSFIADYLGLEDVARNESNVGFTIKDEKIKPKILDFIARGTFYNCDDSEETRNMLKRYLKGWQEDADNWNAYAKRKFAETLDDPKFKELLEVMPKEQKARLDEYCQQIVKIGVEELKVINHKVQEEATQKEADALRTHFNEQPKGGLNFNNIGDNEDRQIFTPSKAKEVKSCLFGCFNSKKNRVDIVR